MLTLSKKKWRSGLGWKSGWIGAEQDRNVLGRESQNDL